MAQKLTSLAGLVALVAVVGAVPAQKYAPGIEIMPAANPQNGQPNYIVVDKDNTQTSSNSQGSGDYPDPHETHGASSPSTSGFPSTHHFSQQPQQFQHTMNPSTSGFPSSQHFSQQPQQFRQTKNYQRHTPDGVEYGTQSEFRSIQQSHGPVVGNHVLPGPHRPAQGHNHQIVAMHGPVVTHHQHFMSDDFSDGEPSFYQQRVFGTNSNHLSSNDLPLQFLRVQ
ncbi:uncharacterized protein LOC128721624 [Anopheles nili]|uniref:uncharacterized protein LOC128721624 n=1 Tax=Anopheles nili TaxID=185578 RepID=UPI00237C43C8|nr:uncharacterized protein LOC128721624 [Anopheles nili]